MKLNFLLTGPTLAIACFSIIGLNSCSKLAKNLQYNLEMQTASVDVVIPPYSDSNVAVSGTQTNYYNIDSFIKKNTGDVLGVSNISSATIKSCVLTLANPTSSRNFANFKSCNASFYTNGNTTPFTVNIPNNPDVYSEQLSLPVDSTAELKGYITNGNQFTYTLGGSIRRPLNDSLHCHMVITFKVHVQG